MPYIYIYGNRIHVIIWKTNIKFFFVIENDKDIENNEDNYKRVFYIRIKLLLNKFKLKDEINSEVPFVFFIY